MSKKLYVGNLAYGATKDHLVELFGQYGEVVSAQIIINKETGQSRGFGFVEMTAGGDEAINALNGQNYQGRNLTVNEARPREDRPMGSAGHGHGYGGHGQGHGEERGGYGGRGDRGDRGDRGYGGGGSGYGGGRGSYGGGNRY